MSPHAFFYFICHEISKVSDSRNTGEIGAEGAAKNALFAGANPTGSTHTSTYVPQPLFWK